MLSKLRSGLEPNKKCNWDCPCKLVFVLKSAAKEAGVPLSIIEGAEDVDQVMVKFFAFVKDAVLVSTDALGNQKNLLCRAARYAGMKSLPNELYDLLDLAGETDSKFDFKSRSELLEMLNIAEGADALGKAKANIAIYTALCKRNQHSRRGGMIGGNT